MLYFIVGNSETPLSYVMKPAAISIMQPIQQPVQEIVNDYQKAVGIKFRDVHALWSKSENCQVNTIETITTCQAGKML